MTPLDMYSSLLSMGRLPIAAILAGPGDEDPSPEGPEGENIGDDDSLPESSERSDKDLQPIPGPGAPMVPDHQNIDANPIDPRVF